MDEGALRRHGSTWPQAVPREEEPSDRGHSLEKKEVRTHRQSLH